MTLNDIKLNPHNPRQITDARFEKLEEYLEEYGDLSGVVYNTNPECVSLIGGHQRLRVFRKKKGKPVILQTFSPPQKDGTTAAGYIELPNGQRYTYREVFWEKAKADAATIIANGEFGQWDSERLATYFEFEPQELEEFGVPTYVFGGVDETLQPENLSDGFSLPDGDRSPFQQMTFSLADEQVRIIQEKIADMKQTEDFKYAETFGNENSNGNALYLIVQKWEGLKTSF